MASKEQNPFDVYIQNRRYTDYPDFSPAPTLEDQELIDMFRHNPLPKDPTDQATVTADNKFIIDPLQMGRRDTYYINLPGTLPHSPENTPLE